MTAWLGLNVALFAALILFGWWGREARAEAGHIHGLFVLFGICGWVAWVLIGSVALLLIHFTGQAASL